MDWKQIVERASRVEQALRHDHLPFCCMDFATRDRYRRAVEEIARRSGQAEEKIAQAAVELAASAGGKAARGTGGGSTPETYLIGEGRGELDKLVGCREAPFFRMLRWAIPPPFPGVLPRARTVLRAVHLADRPARAAGAELPARILISLLSLIPASQIAVEVVNYLVMRIFPPRTLAKMDFEVPGIPDAFRTLVVVPILLEDSRRSGQRWTSSRYGISRIERTICCSACSRITRIRGSRTATRMGRCFRPRSPGSKHSINAMAVSVSSFFTASGAGANPSSNSSAGSESAGSSKSSINSSPAPGRANSAPLIHAGDADRLKDIRFVITLDSDTQLPAGTARRMIGALAHPLNHARPDSRGRMSANSYTILQPRVSPSLPSTLASPFSRLFADAAGIDPYTKAVSDVYQDLAGQGSYNGKGIYDLHSFNRILTRRFPDERLLSHDLIEGEHVRTGLASDIELFDEFPRTYLDYSRRQHRWIRGDWQIIDWLFPVVPLSGGRSGPNQLPIFSRWKIFDNLRRSLIPIADVAFLAAAWAASPQTGWLAALVVGGQLFFHPFTQIFSALTSRQSRLKFSGPQLAHDLLRGAVEAILLPHQAFLAVDAILRTWYRRLISHRGMLRWASAQAVRRLVPDQIAAFVLSMIPFSAGSAAAAWILNSWNPSSLPPAIPWLLGWFVSPIAGWILNLRFHARPRRFALPKTDRLFLRTVARRTWRFFSDYIGNSTSWLPPDNYQVAHLNRVAMRTSPTNIGLGLLSALAAQEFGYITPDRAIQNLTRAMQSIAKLEKFEGHLLNWYDIQTLAPLEPRYVSTVDSGNLLAAFYSLDSGLTELARNPILDGRVFSGLEDTLAILSQTCRREFGSGKSCAPSGNSRTRPRPAGEAHRCVESAPAGRDRYPNPRGAIRRTRREWGVRRMGAPIGKPDLGMGPDRRPVPGLDGDPRGEAEKRDRGFGRFASGLTPGWINPHLWAIYPPGKSLAILELILQEKYRASNPPLAEWLDRLLHSASVSRWLSGEMLGECATLQKNIRAVVEKIDMRFLYHPDRRLFSIGYNVTEGRHDQSHYDLLASEARLGSYIAVARGEVSPEHWFSLGRLFREVKGRQILVSWTGTMFEYLMPLLFQKAYEHSLLERMTRTAVEIQETFGRKNNVPWGISESAFGDLDINKNYQYKAFGVPALGLKRQSEEEIVVAPYASLLAVNIAPKETVRNLRRLESLGALGEFGFYDAIDFSRRAHRKDRQGITIHAYMAHHQSMGFLSLANFLLGNPIPRYFHANPVLRAAEMLLQEKIPVSPPLFLVSSRERASALPRTAESAPLEGRFDTPNTPRPRTQLLGHEQYSVMVTNSGGGYSRWGRQDITRWRSDRTRDSWGTFCYIHDTSTGRIWSNTFHPVGGKAEAIIPFIFAVDRAVFWRTGRGSRHRNGNHCLARGGRRDPPPHPDQPLRTPRGLELTSYMELALAPHDADLQHPAFSKLFVETEAVPELARPAGPPAVAGAGRRTPIWAGHRMVTSTRRNPFRVRDRPRAFHRPGPALAANPGRLPGATNSAGHVLDPVFSLRATVTLDPGQSAPGVPRPGGRRFPGGDPGPGGRFTDPRRSNRCLELAWTHSQLELRRLRIQADDARRFQHLASYLLYPFRSCALGGPDQAEPPGPVPALGPRHLGRPAAGGGDHRRGDATLGWSGRSSQAHTYWNATA